MFELPSHEGKTMACGETIIPYTDEDVDLIKSLKLDDPSSHYLLLGHGLDKRDKRMQSKPTINALADLSSIKMNQLPGQYTVKKMYVIEVSNGKYYVPDFDFKRYALAIEEKLRVFIPPRWRKSNILFKRNKIGRKRRMHFKIFFRTSIPKRGICDDLWSVDFCC